MTTRRRLKHSARLSKYEMEKRRDERFVKNLEEVRDAMDTLISDFEMGYDDDVVDGLEAVGAKLNRVHRQAEGREFGSSVRSKNPAGQVNETLTKILVHNLSHAGSRDVRVGHHAAVHGLGRERAEAAEDYLAVKSTGKAPGLLNRGLCCLALREICDRVEV